MDSLIVYIIIGVIWVFQLIAKKKKEAERGQKSVRPEAESKKDIFDEFSDLLEKGRQADPESYPEPPVYYEKAEQEIGSRKAIAVEGLKIDETEIIKPKETFVPALEEQAPVQPLSKEFLFKKVFKKYKPEADSSQSQVNTSPASYLNGLSVDVLEQGIILSVILGPPKSTQMLRRINRSL